MNNMGQHISDSGPGMVGTSVAGGLTIMGFIADAIPILQVLSLIAGLAVAIVTFLYYQRKLKIDEMHAAATVNAATVRAAGVVAAEAVKATAVVAATALDQASKP